MTTEAMGLAQLAEATVGMIQPLQHSHQPHRPCHPTAPATPTTTNPSTLTHLVATRHSSTLTPSSPAIDPYQWYPTQPTPAPSFPSSPPGSPYQQDPSPPTLAPSSPPVNLASLPVVSDIANASTFIATSGIRHCQPQHPHRHQSVHHPRCPQSILTSAIRHPQPPAPSPSRRP
nr:lysine-rich arabinogalactan protein 19-like [Arachis hypogaea]